MKKNKIVCAIAICLIMPLCFILQGCLSIFLAFSAHRSDPAVNLTIELENSDDSLIIYDNTSDSEPEFDTNIIHNSPYSISIDGNYLEEFSLIRIEISYKVNNFGSLCVVQFNGDYEEEYYISKYNDTSTIKHLPITTNENFIITFEYYQEIEVNLYHASIDLEYSQNSIILVDGHYFFRPPLALKIIPDYGYHLPNSILVESNLMVIDDENYTFAYGVLTFDSEMDFIQPYEITLSAIPNS